MFNCYNIQQWQHHGSSFLPLFLLFFLTDTIDHVEVRPRENLVGHLPAPTAGYRPKSKRDSSFNWNL